MPERTEVQLSENTNVLFIYVIVVYESVKNKFSQNVYVEKKLQNYWCTGKNLHLVALKS